MKKLILFTSIVLLLFFVLQSIFNSKVKNKINLNYHRYEELVFSVNDENYQNIINNFEINHKIFSEFFSNNILNQKDIKNESFKSELYSFTNHPDMREAYDSVSLFFKDLS